MVNLLYAFLAVAAVKVLQNLSRYVQCKRYLTEYTRYVERPDWRFVEHKPKIVELIKGAGIKDCAVPIAEPIGYGRILTGTVSVFDCMDITRKDVVALTRKHFHEAIGVYRSRMWETINPLCWVEWIIYLPRAVSGYLGIPVESIVVRVLQVVWWLSAAVIGLLKLVYQVELDTLINEMIKKLLS